MHQDRIGSIAQLATIILGIGAPGNVLAGRQYKTTPLQRNVLHAGRPCGATSEPKVLRGILSMDELMQTPGMAEMERFIANRVQRDIWLKVIRSEQKDVDAIWPSNVEKLRDLRYAPPEMLLSMTTFIYDHRVCLISSKKENYGLIIESEEFSTMQTVLFDGIWGLSKAPD
jgi:hypothetical protein